MTRPGPASEFDARRHGGPTEIHITPEAVADRESESVTNDVYVGVSGFSYPHWKGKFYPKEAKNEELLAQYAQRLRSVEINSSFYAAPKPPAVKGWAEKTGADFRFSFKAPQLITHILKLGEGSSEAAVRLSETLDLLGPRRGPLLFQLPPYMK